MSRLKKYINKDCLVICPRSAIIGDMVITVRHYPAWISESEIPDVIEVPLVPFDAQTPETTLLTLPH